MSGKARHTRVGPRYSRHSRWTRLLAPLSLIAFAIVCPHPAARAQCMEQPIECDLHETQKVQASDMDARTNFGHSVAIDGDMAAIGAFSREYSGMLDAGAVYLFGRSGGRWQQETILTASDADGGDRFGNLVAIRNDVLIALADRVNCQSEPGYCGALYVFRRTGGVWAEEAKLIPTDIRADDNFGEEIALGDGIIAVGSTRADLGNDPDRGAVYVFRYDGAEWNQEAKLIASDPEFEDGFGSAVALEQNQLLIGAPGADCCGAVYLFSHDGSAWNEDVKLTASDAASGDEFGAAVGLQGGTLVVGTNRDLPACSVCGSVYVFEHDGIDWQEQLQLLPPVLAVGGLFGHALLLSGDRLMVDHWFEGTVYWYERDGETWTKKTRFVRLGQQNYSFGQTIGLSNDDLILGDGHLRCGDCHDCGAAYFFDLSLAAVDCNCNLLADGCERVGNDCNANSVPDDCDIVEGASEDCGNGVPNECDPDCNANGVADDCDIAGGSPDENTNGVPDVCDFAPTAGDNRCSSVAGECFDSEIPCSSNAVCTVPDQLCWLNGRYLSITPTNAVVAGADASIRVEIVSMKECAGGVRAGQGCQGNAHCPGSACIDSPRIGDIWWAGPEVNVPNAPQPALRGAPLQCSATPGNAQVWTMGPLHLYGAPIVPLATYNVRMCDSAGANCSNPLLAGTGAWADVASPLSGFGQPNFTDINQVVVKFRNFASSYSMARVDLVGPGDPGSPNIPNQVVNFADVSNAVSAFSGLRYPYTVPACP